jgi:hypothetical protein
MARRRGEKKIVEGWRPLSIACPRPGTEEVDVNKSNMEAMIRPGSKTNRKA